VEIAHKKSVSTTITPVTSINNKLYGYENKNYVMFRPKISNDVLNISSGHYTEVNIRGCIQKFPDWPPGGAVVSLFCKPV
jgi:hypothetical protein